MINPIFALAKFVVVCLLLILFIVTGVFKGISNSEMERLRILQKHSRKYVRIILKVLGIRVNPINTGNIPTNALMVANHSSYLDVLAIHLVCPSTFVTSKEISETPFLGDLCRASGCLFVNRKSIWNLKQEVQDMARTLNLGSNVVVFPEGTTSDGTVVLPFRSSLLESAAISNKKVCPITINYTRINSTRVSFDNRDYVYWYGKMSFLPHLFNLCRLKSMEISVVFHDATSISAIRDRKVITRMSYDVIKSRVKNLPVHKPFSVEKFYGEKVVAPGQFTIAG